MFKNNLLRFFCTVFVVLTALQQSMAQGITLPPNGGNQKASVIQHMGLVKVQIDYHSPDVTSPQGEDRRGKIWGQLVPYGMNNLGFGTAKESPWRAGANQNTTISFSQDVEVEGKKLAAGTYGLHFIVEKNQWTAIFSTNSTAWGSYFYEPNEDALRVKVSPKASEHAEWLTYEFTDRQLASTTAVLKWESLQVPIKIVVPNINDLYVAKIKKELQSNAGFSGQNWTAAANFCLQNRTHLEQGLIWAEGAISNPFVGQKTFANLQTKASILTALKRDKESDAVMKEALTIAGSTDILAIHGYGRSLIAAGKVDEAMEVFEFNENKFPDTWPVNYGMARAYSAQGKYRKALDYLRKAMTNAPNDASKKNVEANIEKLKKGQDIN
jgi:hypothetical protein